MRILSVSNYYPPFEVGGYEQLCRDVARRLTARGHVVAVLTSNRGREGQETDEEITVHRTLVIQPQSGLRIGPAVQSFITRPFVEAQNRRALLRLVAHFRPDVIFVWNLQGLPQELAVDAETRTQAAVAYWLAGYTPAEPDSFWKYWTAPAHGSTLLRGSKQIVAKLAVAQMRLEGKPVQPMMRHAAVVSEYMRQKCVAEDTLPADARIIYNGVELDQFVPVQREFDGRLRLLVAGRVSEDKGIHTAIMAVKTLVSQGVTGISLDIVGAGPDSYLDHLRSLIVSGGVESFVQLRDWVDRSAMPCLMANSDVLILPSVYPEALPRVALEAMAAGLVVVATPVGGTQEIVEHNISGLLFRPGDAADLAKAINRLLSEPALSARLAAEGRQRVVSRFSLDNMVDGVERLLQDAVVGQVSTLPAGRRELKPGETLFSG